MKHTHTVLNVVVFMNYFTTTNLHHYLSTVLVVERRSVQLASQSCAWLEWGERFLDSFEHGMIGLMVRSFKASCYALQLQVHLQLAAT